MAWVFAHSPAEGTDRLVLLSLANHANELGQSWPSVATIAQEANVSERAVQRSLASLRAAGALEVVANGAPDERIRRDRRPNLYRVLKTARGDADGTSQRGDGVTGESPGEASRGDAGGSHGVTLVTERGDAGDTQTIIEPSLNHLAESLSASSGSVKPKRKRDELFDAIVAVCHLNVEQLTKDERGRVNSAVKQIREVGGSGVDVAARAAKFRAKYPTASLTPQAISANWSALGTPTATVLARCDACGLPLNDDHDESACRSRMRMLGRSA